MGGETVVPDPEFYANFFNKFRGILEMCGELQVFGQENIEVNPRTIYIAPHQNPFDPAMLGSALLDHTPNSMAVPFIGTRGIWTTPLVGRLTGRLADRMGTIPIERKKINGPIFFERAEHALTNDAQSLAVFPEGDLIHGNKIKTVLAGVPILAALGGAVIQPVGISGMDYLDFGNFTIFFGQQFTVEKLDIPMPTDRRSFSIAGRATKDIRERMHIDLQSAFDEAARLRASRLPMNTRQRIIAQIFSKAYGVFAK